MQANQVHYNRKTSSNQSNYKSRIHMSQPITPFRMLKNSATFQLNPQQQKQQQYLSKMSKILIKGKNLDQYFLSYSKEKPIGQYAFSSNVTPKTNKKPSKIPLNVALSKKKAKSIARNKTEEREPSIYLKPSNDQRLLEQIDLPFLHSYKMWKLRKAFNEKYNYKLNHHSTKTKTIQASSEQFSSNSIMPCLQKLLKDVQPSSPKPKPSKNQILYIIPKIVEKKKTNKIFIPNTKKKIHKKKTIKQQQYIKIKDETLQPWATQQDTL